MSEWILDVTAQNFRTEVIERSLTIPVVVDFWAEWCGPCKELTPALEQAARDGNGRFLLAKVDVDKNPELAQAFQVQGIPTVLGVQGGRVVDGFSGALPPAELERFLGSVAPPLGPTPLEAARALAAEGNLGEAIALLRTHLAESASDHEARIELASLLVDDGKLDDAKSEWAELSDEARESEAGATLATKLEYAENAGDLGELEAAVTAAPEDPAARIAYGKGLIAAQKYEDALKQLIEAVELDPKFDDSAARKAMLEVFDILGTEDPLANDYRFKLSLLLFS
ncbi:MAG: tetratricopeptide repeat protein [Planctomycetota bacterium]